MGENPTAIDTGDLRDLDAWAPGGGQGNFDFVVYRNVIGAPASGQITFVNKLTGDSVKSTAITSFSVNSNQATFGGTCTNSKTPLLPCTFRSRSRTTATPARTATRSASPASASLPNQGTLTRRQHLRSPPQLVSSTPHAYNERKPDRP